MRIFHALSVLCAILSITAFSQTTAVKQHYSLSGCITDSVSRNAIPGVNVIVYSQKIQKQLGGAATDINGAFRIPELSETEVSIKFSIIGYRTKVINIVLTPKKNTAVLDTIRLSSAVLTMGSVEITAVKPMIEYLIDKQVVHMDKVPGGSGSVADALKSTGSVDIDPVSNKVSLRGRSEVNIMIDGKPMPGAETLISQMPASGVDKVEIITNPGAKEDAEGDAGIINIITKKSERNSYNGSVNLTFSTRKINLGTVALNYRKDRLNLYSSFTGGLGTENFENKSERINFNSLTNHTLSSLENSDMHGHLAFLKLGADYDLNDENSVSLTGSFLNLSFDNNRNGNQNVVRSDNILNYSYLQKNNGSNANINYNFTAFYKRKFNGQGHEITADAYYSKIDMDNDNEQKITYQYDPSFPFMQNSFNNIDNKTLILKTDYVNPSKSFGKIETGYRFTFRDRGNDYTIMNYAYGDARWHDDMNYCNRFYYKENIHALYLSYTNKILFLDYIAGLRYEATLTEGRQVMNGGSSFSHDYSSFFPSFNIAYKINNEFQIMFNTARRINRPRMEYINPFTRVDGPNSFSRGNPQLDPAYVNLYELKFSPVLNLFHTNSTGRPYWLDTIERDSIKYSSVINCGRTKTYGVEVTLPLINDKRSPVKLPAWLNMINVFYSYTHVIDEGIYLNEDYSATKNTWSVSVNTSLNLWYDIGLMINFRYRPKTEDRRTITYENKNLTCSLSRDFFEDKLTVSLMLNDLLNSNTYRTENIGSNYRSDFSNTNIHSRGAFLSFTYNFNDFKAKRDRNIDDGRDKTEGGLF